MSIVGDCIVLGSGLLGAFFLILGLILAVVRETVCEDGYRRVDQRYCINETIWEELAFEGTPLYPYHEASVGLLITAGILGAVCLGWFYRELLCSVGTTGWLKIKEKVNSLRN